MFQMLRFFLLLSADYFLFFLFAYDWWYPLCLDRLVLNDLLLLSVLKHLNMLPLATNAN